MLYLNFHSILLLRFPLIKNFSPIIPVRIRACTDRKTLDHPRIGERDIYSVHGRHSSTEPIDVEENVAGATINKQFESQARPTFENVPVNRSNRSSKGNPRLLESGPSEIFLLDRFSIDIPGDGVAVERPVASFIDKTSLGRILCTDRRTIGDLTRDSSSPRDTPLLVTFS